jgi:hypothetical protein
MFGKKYKERAERNGSLALELTKRLAAELEKKLNENNGSKNYTVTVRAGGGKEESFVAFKITRGNIPDRSDFHACFVALVENDTFHYILEIPKYEENKLSDEEYRHLHLTLINLFNGFRVIEWDHFVYDSGNRCFVAYIDKDGKRQEVRLHDD